jgi:hypothetical protein
LQALAFKAQTATWLRTLYKQFVAKLQDTYTHSKGFITARQTACSPVKTKQRPRIASNLLAIDFPIYEETDMFLCPIPSTSAYHPIRS